MAAPPLATMNVCGMTCVGVEGRPRGVAFAFVGRTGGVSVGDFASLNVGGGVGDDASAVAENRCRALTAIGASEPAVQARTVVPRQVHGSDVVCVDASEAVAVADARSHVSVAADALVVAVEGVPALMAFADCVPVVMVAPGAFAIVHSGWRGTRARIVAKAALALARSASCSVGELWAYIGPHVAPESYEVSADLADVFRAEFGDGVLAGGGRNLDLGAAVASTLREVGVASDGMVDCGIDTVASTDAWYSYRASGGHTGRHAAVAWVVDRAADKPRANAGHPSGRRAALSPC